MTRRALLLALGFSGIWIKIWPDRLVAAGQTDPDWIRMWEAAQKERPAQIPSAARIAPASEPGQPLVIHGRVFGKDGRQPRAGTIVFAYQTGQDGLYQRPGRSGWRLQGWAKTTTDGAFEFQTIRPGPYPGRAIPAHVHLSVDGAGVPREWLDELQFADDALVKEEERRKSDQAGLFGTIRPVRTIDGVQHCDINFRITGAHRF
jgi:protocatechuate 3,4-dioxygenase beta subunit